MSPFWVSTAVVFVITGGPFALVAFVLDFAAETFDALRGAVLATEARAMAAVKRR